MCTLPSAATLKAGRRHLARLLQEARGNLSPADAMAYEIALDAIDYSLERQEQERKAARTDREIDLTILRIMDRAGRG